MSWNGGCRSCGGWAWWGEMASVSLAEVGDQFPIAFGRVSHPRVSIQPSYDGQEHSALLALIPDFENQPPLRLNTFRIPGGYVFFGAGQDGIAATADGATIRETALFSRGFSPPTCEELCSVAVDVDDDWVTVVDCAWRNHFHLLTLAMPKLYLARLYLPNAQVVIPASRRSQSLAGELADPLERFITIANLTRAVRRVDDGVYRVKNLHIIWSIPCSRDNPGKSHWLAPYVGSSCRFGFSGSRVTRVF